MIDLSGYGAVRTSLFVRIDIIDYETLLFSDHNIPFTYNGDVYNTLGRLMNVTSSSSDLRAAPGDITVTISGIPNAYLQEILDLRIKGSDVQIYRGFFDPVTGAEIAIPGNGGSGVIGKFRGRVMTVGVQEDWDPQGSSSSITIQFSCSSQVALLSNKTAGRRTNPIDQKALYPTDTCFDTTLALTKSNFNFGAPG